MRYPTLLSLRFFVRRIVRRALIEESSDAGETQRMDEEVNAMRGILLGVLTGATLWLMIYAATFL